jgi:hypothetical protein
MTMTSSAATGLEIRGAQLHKGRQTRIHRDYPWLVGTRRLHRRGAASRAFSLALSRDIDTRILERGIYACAALLGAIVLVASAKTGAFSAWTPWCATIVSVGVRLLALYYGWRLPVYRGTKGQRKNERAQIKV